MNIRGSSGDSNVGARIHDDLRVMWIGQTQGGLRQFEQSSGAEIFFANLNPRYTRGQTAPDCLQQRAGRQRSPIRYVTPDQRTPRFLSARRTRDSSMPK